MAQSFADFMDRSTITKTIVSAYYGLMVGVVSPECKHEAMKFSPEELISSNFKKIIINMYMYVCMSLNSSNTIIQSTIIDLL